MTIQVHIQVSGENGGDIANDLKSLLSRLTGYSGEPVGYTEDLSNRIAEATTESTKSRKAREKAAEAAAKAAAEAAAKEKAAQNIANGGEHTDPAVEKQDAADEAADAKAATPEPIRFNHDTVRKMLGGYVQAYGMEAAQTDGAKLIEIAKISDLADDQKVFAKAIIAIASGIEKNPYSREIAGDGITAEKLAELKPIVQAAMAVK